MTSSLFASTRVCWRDRRFAILQSPDGHKELDFPFQPLLILDTSSGVRNRWGLNMLRPQTSDWEVLFRVGFHPEGRKSDSEGCFDLKCDRSMSGTGLVAHLEDT